MAREVKIIIDKNGVHIDFSGFKGDACFKEREKIIELLKKYGINVNVEYEEKKPEAYTEEKEVVMW